MNFRFAMTFLIGLGAALLLAAILFVAIGRENVWVAFVGDPDLGRTDFKTLKIGPKPNQALICPTGFCPNAEPDAEPPVFDLSPTELRTKFRMAMRSEDLLKRMHVNDAALRERYVQRSPIMRFPDTIQIEFIDLTDQEGNERSTIALYAHAQMGYSDLGANLRRVKRWIRKLEAQVGDTGSRS